MSIEADENRPPIPPLEPVEQLVICVDDDQNFLKSLEFFLPDKINQEGDSQVWYRFLFFDNPLNALDTLRELTESREVVAMVISDQKMPDYEGNRVTRRGQKDLQTEYQGSPYRLCGHGIGHHGHQRESAGQISHQAHRG